ncbi:uncharacterized protein VTP21DRAFT_9864 [Calcarisporiella thermophila]|uniref:uncharacterized protein n=1 Tax=Calcarisporiella thermophila TaxID=911321 RepID=UPI003742DC06
MTVTLGTRRFSGQKSKVSKDRISLPISIPIRNDPSIGAPQKVIKALCDHRAPHPERGELSFRQGDFFHVLHEYNPYWYEASNPLTNVRGLVPAHYFQVVEKFARRKRADSGTFVWDDDMAPSQKPSRVASTEKVGSNTPFQKTDADRTRFRVKIITVEDIFVARLPLDVTYDELCCVVMDCLGTEVMGVLFYRHSTTRNLTPLLSDADLDRALVNLNSETKKLELYVSQSFKPKKFGA